jgi:hypothetical protein
MKIGLEVREQRYFHHPLHFQGRTMNTMINTADFSNQIAEADHSDFFPALFKKLFALFLLSGGVNSIDTALLAERIVQE